MEPPNLTPVGKGDPDYWKPSNRRAIVEEHELIPMPMQGTLISDEEIKQACEGATNVVISTNNDPSNGQPISKTIGIRYKRFSQSVDITNKMIWPEQKDAIAETVRDLKAMNRKYEYQIIEAAKAAGRPAPDFSKEDFKQKVIQAKPVPVPQPSLANSEYATKAEVKALEDKLDRILKAVEPKE